MAFESVGDVSVDVGADAGKFMRDMRGRAAAQISASAAKVGKRASKSLNSQFTAPVVDIKINDAAIAAEARRAQQILDKAEASLPLTVEGERARREMRMRVAEIQAQAQKMDIEVPLDLGSAAAARVELASSIAGLQAMANVSPVTVPVTVSRLSQVTTFFQSLGSRLGAGTGTAYLTAFNRVTAQPRALTKMMSGWNIFQSKFDLFSKMARNLDKALIPVSALSMGFASLTSVAGTGLGNILGIVNGIASIVQVGLALPAVLGGAAVSVGVLIAAFKDAGEYLGQFKDDFGALQDVISDSFWSQAAAPIQNMLTTLLPSLNTALEGVAGSLGGMFAGMADTISGAGAGFERFSALLSQGIDNATAGMQAFLSAFGGLAEAGAQYLPTLGTMFSNLGADFDSWVQRITSDGSFEQFVETGAAALRDLGSVIGSLVGIFGGLGRAAQAAGGSTLSSLADTLDRWNEVVNGPAFQGALTSVFEGLNAATANLGPGMSALGDAFVSLAPTIESLLPQLTAMVSTLAEGLAGALSNPVFQTGLTAFFDGIEVAISKIVPYMPMLGDAIGRLAATAGTLAPIVGDVLAAAFAQFEPLLPVITDAISTLVPILGGALVSAINAVGPVLMDLVTAFGNFVQNNPKLAATILAVVAGLGTLAAGAVKVLGAVSPLLAMFDIKMITALTKVGGALAKVGGWFLKLPGTILKFAGTIGSLVAKFAMMMGPVGWAVTAIAALAAGAIWAYNNFEPFRRVVDAVAGAIMGALRAALDWLVMAWETVSTAVSTAMSTVWATIQSVWTTISTTITETMTAIWTTITETWTTITTTISEAMTAIWTTVTEAWTLITTAVVTAVSGLWTSITTALAPITEGLALFWQGIQDMFTLALDLIKFGWDLAWNALAEVVTTVWTAITTSIQTAIDFVSSIISTVLTAISTTWSSIWDAISSTVSTVWEAIKGYVNAGLTFISGIVSSVLGVIRGVFSTVWNAISGTLSTVWGTIKSVVSTGINYVRDTVSNILGQVRDKFREIWDSIKTKVSDVLSSIRSTVSERMEAIRSKVSASMDRTKQIFKDAWDRIKTSVSEAIGNVLDKVREIPGKITSALGDMSGLLYQAGKDVIQGLINGIGSMAGNVGSAMSGIASKIGGFLPGSPVKEGPLRSWNNGAAGKRLVNLLTDGIAGSESAASEAMKRLSSKVNSSLMPVEMSVRRSLGSSSMSLTPPTPSRPASSGAGAAAASSGMMRMHPDDISLLAQAVISGAEKMSNRAVREYDMIKARSMR